ncbi:MAG: hypothetical protein H7A05_07865 [Pseudomonadales bacterium]|nr:hypothetical protein [Pseudomonadales bacterium]MCP5344521.1 hypothetical protein [Pseudomonadales bacterium]
MSLRVLEFNDAGLRLSDEQGIVLSSPGYALVLPKRIEFGEKALAHSRINPLNSYNQFWHKLSLDPFSRSIAHYRHNADLAFSHLQDLAETAQLEGDVLLAVPGSFSREQMGILLGLIRQGPFRAVGIVDSGLAATVDQAYEESLIHVDLQLHQVVLSKLQRSGDELRRDSVVVVPGTGWVNLTDSLIQLATNAFIQQCRFNPQHNAESEQMLLDGIPQWLRDEAALLTQDEDDRRSIEIRLPHNNTVHVANLPRSALSTRLQSYYQKVLQQLQLLDPTQSSTLVFSDRLQTLPGLHEILQGRDIRMLPEDAIGSACLRYRDTLSSAPEAVRFVSQLRSTAMASEQAAVTPDAARPVPTHVLLRHQAHRLNDGLRICRDDTGRLSVHPVQQAPQDLCIAGEIVWRDGHIVLQASADLQLNERALEVPQTLQLGDRIRVKGVSDALELIRVQDHDE